MDSHEPGEVVHTVFTETSIFIAPDGEKYPYLHILATVGDGTQANLLFNAQLTVFLLDAVTRYMGTVFNVPEVGKTLAQAMDDPIDWDNMSPPLEEPDLEPDPDRKHDQGPTP